MASEVAERRRPVKVKPADTTADAPPLTAPGQDLDAPELYLSRELTWLAFNRRVLHEAQDERTPLLERVKFLAIVHSNLDEFFMKRIGGLKQQVGAGVQTPSVDGHTPAEQIRACYTVIRDTVGEVRQLANELMRQLEREGIRVAHFDALTRAEQAQLREHFRSEILPLLTPLAIDPAHPFPFISNLSVNLLVAVRCADTARTTLIRIKVPTGGGQPRFVEVGTQSVFVPLEDLIANHLDLLFPGMTIESCEFFRIARNAVTERSEDEADDLMALIESELRDRKFAPVVRLGVSRNMCAVHRGMLAAELGLDQTSEVDTFEVDGLLGARDLFQIAALDRPELHDPPHHPLDHAALAGAPNIFHAIRDHGALLVQHPYESFTTSVERFVEEASRDPKVLAIKMTIYRTASESRIIDLLIQAAQNGKQVAVVVELKARFDESANIRWANHLEEAGIHVSYGVVGLKTHCKLIYVLRRDYDGLRRYAHLGTGNYHAGTARLYSDLGLFTCDPEIGEDLTEFFNFLTSGQAAERSYRKLLPAPKHLKRALLDKIEREISIHRDDAPGLIQFKMNALEDVDITRALYRASRIGVNVDLIVRDTCRLRPGLAGLSEHVRVVSIVGRFLEHARIYYFQNGGDEEYFIGSADCMTRNLESRVEVVTPVEKPELRALLREVLDVQLNDPRSAWDMQADGSYRQRRPEDDRPGAQEILMELAARRNHDGTRTEGGRKGV